MVIWLWQLTDFMYIRLIDYSTVFFFHSIAANRKKFDEMWDLPKWYISACSNSVQYVRLHPILMSILLYNFKELTKSIEEVERIEGRVNSSKKKKWLTKREEERPQEKQEVPTVTLDSWFTKNKAHVK